jgi:diguanylate cyclase (GGDEF)-like protein
MALSKTTTEPVTGNPVEPDPAQAAEQFKLHLGYLQEILQGANRQAIIDCLTRDPSATPFQRRMLMEFLDGVHKTGSANRDELTGMLTRSSLLDRFSQKNPSAHHKKTALTLYFIDLDGFKRINDEHGHAIGDQVLTAVGARIQGAIRPADMAVRWGGDEFIVVFEDVHEPDVVIQLAARLLRIITAPLHLSSEQSIEVTLGASIGIAIGADGTTSISDLIDQADQAMYQAKKSGTNSIYIFP